MLILKQCQKLKEWGLPQTSHDFSGGAGSVPYTICCPDLEQLLEFAYSIAKIPIFIGRVSDQDGNKFQTHTVKWDYCEAPDPKQAIYKLLEQIIEPNNKVEESEDG